MTNNVQKIPEIVFHINSFLELKDIPSCRLVCRDWSELFLPKEMQVYLQFKEQLKNQQFKKTIVHCRYNEKICFEKDHITYKIFNDAIIINNHLSFPAEKKYPYSQELPIFQSCMIDAKSLILHSQKSFYKWDFNLEQPFTLLSENDSKSFEPYLNFQDFDSTAENLNVNLPEPDDSLIFKKPWNDWILAIDKINLVKLYKKDAGQFKLSKQLPIHIDIKYDIHAIAIKNDFLFLSTSNNRVIAFDLISKEIVHESVELTAYSMTTTETQVILKNPEEMIFWDFSTLPEETKPLEGLSNCSII